MRAFVLIFLLASALAAQPEIPDQQYRCPPEDTCKTLHSLPAFVQPPGANYSINYVEFNDKGKSFNEHELPDALAQISKAQADNPYVFVFLYVHGWQNNADEVLTSDPVNFSKAVASISSKFFPGSTPAGKAPPVVGIYLAWRGLTFTFEPFKHIISYWPRRQVARAIGGEGMFQALRQIAVGVGQNRDRTMFVCIGHSFGARVLEAAAETLDPRHPERTGFMREFRLQVKARASHPANKEEESNRLAPSDLIFYVNAATSSAVTRETIADLKSVCKEAPGSPICESRPMYLAITSTADWETRFVMPVANLVIPALKTDGLRLVSAANSPTLHTHHLPDKVHCPPPAEPLRCAEPNSFCFVTGQGPNSSCYQVLPIESKAAVPFWVMNVKSDIIENHGDVWNPNVLAMVKAISDQNKHFIRMRAAAPPKPLEPSGAPEQATVR